MFPKLFSNHVSLFIFNLREIFIKCVIVNESVFNYLELPNKKRIKSTGYSSGSSYQFSPMKKVLLVK